MNLSFSSLSNYVSSSACIKANVESIQYDKRMDSRSYFDLR